jgi:type IV pilus assembly protein PilV
MASQKNPEFRRGAERGFTIVESMIALLVLTIGMLGIAAMYLESLRSSRDALYYTHAVNLAADMADRIRSNREAIESYGFVMDTANLPTAPTPDPCRQRGAGACTPQAEATTDLSEWASSVVGLLPAAQATITAARGLPDQYTIQLAWTEVGRDPSNPATYQLAFESSHELPDPAP